MNADEAIWREFVAGKLTGLTSELTPILQKLVRHSYPSEVASIDFEIFSDGFTDRFPLRVFFMDDENNEFFLYENGKPKYPSPVDPGLLEIDHVYSLEEEEAHGDAAGETDMWALASDELIKWFGGCWKAAGGDDLPIRSSIGEHDDAETVVELPTRRTR